MYDNDKSPLGTLLGGLFVILTALAAYYHYT